ncbi:MAG: DUF4397 domain-containing protein [Rhodocyclaceae bacterium]|nr:DUF4397 domain-containing protein [Rhodocyclaceae bacterium]
MKVSMGRFGGTAGVRLLFTSILMVAVSLISTGCGKNAAKSEDASVRMINLAPESGSLSVLLNTESSNWQSNVGYKESTGFKSIANGSQRVRISNAGGVIVDTSIGFSGQRKQLLVVYGGQSSVGVSILQNDIAASSQGNSKLRVVSYAVGLAAFDVYMTTATEDYRTVEPKLRNVTGGVYETPVGTYTIRLTSTGTKDLLFEMPARAFEDRKYYNLGLFNEGSGALPNAFFVTQDDDTAPTVLTSTVSRVRAINAQATNATVNVRVGTTLAFTNIPFGGISSYTRTAAGDGSVAFTDTTAGATLSAFSGTFAGGRDYSVFLAPGLAGGPVTAFRTLDTTFPPSSGKARVRLVNASSAADLALALSFTPTTPAVATRAASNYFEVAPGAGTPVTITQGTTATPVLSLTGTDLTAGLTYTFVVSGTPGALILTVRQDN